MREQHRPDQVDVKRVAHLVGLELGVLAGPLDAGVVDQDVRYVADALAVGEDAGTVLRVGDVGDQRVAGQTVAERQQAAASMSTSMSTAPRRDRSVAMVVPSPPAAPVIST